MVPKLCSIPECSRPHHGRTYCKYHARLTQKETPRRPIKSAPELRLPPVERFWSKVDKTATCWEWQGTRVQSGHGHFKVDGKNVGAHRFSYEAANGTIPAGLVIDHICHNPSCVNPSHLRAVTQKQNIEHQIRAHSGSKSGVRGVYKGAYGKWRTQVRHHGKNISAGCFDSLEEAEAAVIAKRNELFTCNDADRMAKNLERAA